MRPMLATHGDSVPAGVEWSHEVKWDGMRLLADVRSGRTRLTSRNENDVTAAWPDVAEPPLGERDVLVDGEVIALNERGLPDFRVLQERMHVRKAASVQRLVATVPVTFMVFDLLRLDDRDLLREPLETRRALLREAFDGSSWQVPASYDDGQMLHAATLEQGLEGIVSKRRDSRYVPGERSRAWLKMPHRHRGSYVVGGWRPQVGTAGTTSTGRLAALLVGEMTPDGLSYRGRVGSGIAAKQSPELQELLAPLERGESPFADEVPRIDARDTHWVEPAVVVDLDTHGHGYDRLRQPSYQGVRSDLRPEDL